MEISQNKTLHFLKTFLLHFIILTLISVSFRVFFAWRFGWLNWETMGAGIVFGLRFDMAISAALAFLCTLIAFIASRPFVLATAYVLLLGSLFSDLLYFQESNRHLSYEVWDFFNAFNELLTYLKNYWFYFGTIAVLIFLLSKLMRYIVFWDSKYSVKSILLQIFISSLVTLFSIRGGFTGIPQNPALAYKAGSHTQAQVALNGAYGIFYSLISGRHLKPENIVLPENIDVEAKIQKIYANHEVQKPIPQKYNIILIFLEGWPAEYSKSYGHDQDVTPNFDRIRAKSITTAATLAGGKRTTEGMFATFCSYQNPLGKTIMFNHLENQKYVCLPEILKQNGWFTAYLQGTNNMTSGVGAFTYKAGVVLTGGKKEFPRYHEVEKNSWGLFDSDLYGWVYDEMKKAPEPFMFSIGTNTTHDIMLRKGEPYVFGQETMQEKLKSVLHSADKDFGDFVNKVESEAWKYPVLYVLVSDHSSFTTSSSFNAFRVPFAIYSKDLKPQYYDFAISQRDIAPTVLDLLGIEAPDMTGVSLFRKTDLRFAEYYSNPWLGVIVNESFVEWNTKNPNDRKCYSWRTDFKLQNPYECKPEDIDAGLLGLSFTYKSQELLFKNKASKFMTEIQN